MSKEASNNYSGIEQSIESCYASNGMRLICDFRDSYTTTIGCIVPAGAMYEMPNERGSAIFLEHLLFRRTRYSNPEEIEKSLGDVGGKVAAIAMRDMFLFYGTVQTCAIDTLIQLFANVILDGVICDADVEREKCVILYELSKLESDKEQVVMDYFSTMAYQDTGLANSVYPETETIKKFRANNLMEFRDRLFKTYFMTMVCSGPVCEPELQKLVHKYFSTDADDHETSVDLAYKMQSCLKSREYRFSSCELRFRDDDEKLGYVAIGVEGPGCNQPEDHFALNVAKEFVGAWDRTYSGANHNAPFLAHYAFNTDLCDMYKSFFHYWAQTTSIWGCYFVCGKLSLQCMTGEVQKEWMRLCTTVTEKQIRRAANQCRTKELMLLNDPTARFFDIVKHIFRYGYYESIPSRAHKYEKITPDKVREVCERYIYDQSPVVIAVGRIENMLEYYNVRNGMYLLRY